MRARSAAWGQPEGSARGFGPSRARDPLPLPHELPHPVGEPAFSPAWAPTVQLPIEAALVAAFTLSTIAVVGLGLGSHPVALRATLHAVAGVLLRTVATAQGDEIAPTTSFVVRMALA